MENRVFASLANGDVVVYFREASKHEKAKQFLKSPSYLTFFVSLFVI